MVSYNTCALTLQALRSVVEETSATTFELLIVDNASRDGSADAIRAEFPEAQLRALPENIGFGRAVNLAAQDAQGAVGDKLSPDETEPSPPKPFPWRIFAVLASVVVIAVVILVVVFVWPRPFDGGGVSVAPFILEGGNDISFGVPLSDRSPVKIRVTAEWRGGARGLAVTLLAPDGSVVGKPVVVNRDVPWVEFNLDEEHVDQGVDGWVVNLKNTSRRGIAEGTVKLSLSSLK